MPSIQLRLFKNIQMFVAVSGVDVVIDKEVTSGLTECEKMNGFKTAVMHLINISVMPCPIILCSSMVLVKL